MNRILAAVAVALLAELVSPTVTVAAKPEAVETPSSPNILFIVSDDHGSE